MRPIDADALRLMKVAECEGHTIEYAWGWKSCVEYCKNDAPIIKAEPDKDWISIKDRLPEPETWVLVFARQGSYMNLKVDYITRDGIWLKSMCVTHWQPLPEPPKGE